jgi:hypothetical protein
MTNLLEQAINSDDSHHAAKIIQHALSIVSDDVANPAGCGTPRPARPLPWPASPSVHLAQPAFAR